MLSEEPVFDLVTRNDTSYQYIVLVVTSTLRVTHNIQHTPRSSTVIRSSTTIAATIVGGSLYSYATLESLEYIHLLVLLLVCRPLQNYKVFCRPTNPPPKRLEVWSKTSAPFIRRTRKSNPPISSIHRPITRTT